MENLERLARAAGQGDREAFGRLVGRTQADVWRFARALTGDANLAGDVTQETYARAIRSLRGFRGEGSVRSSLLTIARRVAAVEIRGRQPRFLGPEVALGVVQRRCGNDPDPGTERMRPGPPPDQETAA